MTVKIIEGFEAGAVSPQCQGLTGTNATIDSTVKRTGGYSMKMDMPTGNITRARYFYLAADGTQTGMAIATGTPIYVQWYFYVESLPSSGSDDMIFSTQGTTLGVRQATLAIKSDGKLELWGSTEGGLRATSTTALSVGVWYRLALKIAAGSSQPYELRINGTTEFSGTANFGSASIDRIEFGCQTRGINGTTSAGTITFYYDDIIMDDATWPPDGKVLIAVPKANGSTQQWTTGTNSSNYQEVDDAPGDGGVTYVKCGTGGNQVALFNLQDCADIGIATGSTINAVLTAISVREDTSVTSSNKIRVRSNSSNFDNTGLNHTTTYAVKGRFDATDPGTGVAWTTSGFDAFEVGSIEVNSVSMRMDFANAQVHYTPPPQDTKSFFMLVGG